MSKIIIRQARPQDIEAMTVLLQELFSIEADFTVDTSRQRRGLLMMLKEGNGQVVLVAETDDRVVGMCSMQELVSTAEGGPVGLVEDVAVKEEFRGRGIGTRLMDELEELGSRRGLLRLQLLADRENRPALGFYGKRGWGATQLVCLRKTNSKFEVGSSKEQDYGAHTEISMAKEGKHRSKSSVFPSNLGLRSPNATK